MRQPLTIPVRTVRRPVSRQAGAYSPWTEPTPIRPAAAQRIAMEVHAEIEVMCSKFPKPTPIVVPSSGLCHKPIEETFQGHLLQYWCVRSPGHAGTCSGKRGMLLAAAPDEVPVHEVPLDVDHQDAWGCLDAPVAT
jgi:hypothetical protein